MPTLAELRARKAKLPTHVQRITLDQDLIADVQRLETERSDLNVQVRGTDEEGNQVGEPRKAGQGASQVRRLEEIAEELRALYERIRESEGELLLRGLSGGEWQRYKDEHPPREDNVTDKRVGYGIVNATDLLNDLDKFAAEWDGEPLTADDWRMLAGQIPPGDLREMVTAVIVMHESSGFRVPFSLTASSSTKDSATD